MTKCLLPLLVVALLTGSLTGCSSLYSMTQGSIPQPYAATSEVGETIVQTSRAEDGMEALGKLFLPIFVLDFVGSAVVETAILPVTLTNAVFFSNSPSSFRASSP